VMGGDEHAAGSVGTFQHGESLEGKGTEQHASSC
jgi:hypothetical protein